MNKKRTEHTYQLKGTILSRQLWEASPESKYAGQEYYRLRIIQPDLFTKSIQVFPNKLTNPQIWTTLRKAKHGELPKKKYLFHCRNQRGYYYLIDWEELPEVQTPQAEKGEDQ